MAYTGAHFVPIAVPLICMYAFLSKVNVLYSTTIFNASKINSFGIFYALFSGYFSSQNLIESCPRLLSMFVYMFEISTAASI